MQSSTQQEYIGLEELLYAERHMKKYNTFIVKKFISTFLKEKCQKVVDFGAGIGTLSLIVRDMTGIAPLSVEIDPKNTDYLTQRGFDVHACLNEIEGNVDAIFSSNVLEHIEDDQNTLDSFHNKLKEGGLLFLYLPAFQFLFSGLDEKVGHYRRYNKSDLMRKVRDAKFEILHCEYADSLGFFASMSMKVLGYNPEGGIGSPRSLEFYDKYVLPLSILSDKIGARYLLGKNIMLLARRTSQ